jgi:hypothetical protein
MPYLRDELRGSLSSLRPIRGSRPVDLVIVDGDAIAGAGLARMRRVKRNLDAGRWVLALDVSDEDRRAVKELTGFKGGTGYSSAILFRRAPAGGVDQVRIVESHVTTRLEERRHPRTVARVTAQLLADELRTAPRARAAADKPVPTELQHVQFSYTTEDSSQFDRLAWNATVQPQTPNWSVDSTYDVFLDNSTQRPQGANQWVRVKVDGSFAPKRASERWSADGWQSYSWWTGAAALSLQPVLGTGRDGRLSLVQASPETENEETEYSVGSSFHVGFSGEAGGSEEEGAEGSAGVDLGWEFSEHRSFKVKDWTVREQSQPGDALAGWRFAARNPCDVRDLKPDRAHNCFATSWRGPLEPNELSKGTLDFHSAAVYRTKEVVRDSVLFGTRLGFTLVDTFSDHCAAVCYDQSYHTYEVSDGDQHEVDLGTVVPIPIWKIEFSPGKAVPEGAQVPAGTRAVGSVHLTGPANMDLTIPLSSSSPNVTVDRLVKIKKGQTSGTFQVLTNANGMQPGQRLTAVVSTFYGEPFNAQLVLERPAA